MIAERRESKKRRTRSKQILRILFLMVVLEFFLTHFALDDQSRWHSTPHMPIHTFQSAVQIRAASAAH